MALSKAISVQEVTSLFQSVMIYDQISVTAFVLYNLYTHLPIKIASLYISLFQRRQMTNDISEYSLRWPEIVQIIREILVDFYIVNLRFYLRSTVFSTPMKYKTRTIIKVNLFFQNVAYYKDVKFSVFTLQCTKVAENDVRKMIYGVIKAKVINVSETKNDKLLGEISPEAQ